MDATIVPTEIRNEFTPTDYEIWITRGISYRTTYSKHFAEIEATARYASLVGKANIAIVDDAEPGEIADGYYFRAVAFDHHGKRVMARTIFDVQYHFS